MKDKEISIKSSLETIQVPTQKLDQIIDDSLFNPPLQKTRSRKRFYQVAAAVALIIGISTTSMIVSPALANFVAQIPIIGSVFDYFAVDNDEFESYGRFSESVGLSQSSKGIDITIDQAVYDGTNVTISFMLKSEEPLGEAIEIAGFPIVKGAEGSNSGMEYEYVENVGYVGLLTITPDFDNDTERAQAYVSWKPTTIITDTKEIDGNWTFEFAVSQISGEPIVVDEKVTADGVTVHLKEITLTDVSVNIAYQQLVEPSLLEEWEAVEAELIASDNLGNVYKVPYNGGSTDGSARTREDFNWTATLGGLNPEATSLTFYPFATVSRFNTETNEGESKKLEFDAIEIDLIKQSYKIVKNPTIPKLPE
jgi:hypothetical protein